MEKTVLPSGLRLITVPMPQVKSVSALVMVSAGSRYESFENNGVSHFLEHMMFKGTTKRPNKMAISSLLDGIGASFNAFTSKEYTGFYVKAASEHIDLMLDVLSDITLHSTFDQKAIDEDRGVIIEEINMYEDEPSVRVSELFEELLYQKSPLAMRISGPKENIAKMSRDQIVSYFNQMYHSSSIVVGLAGNFGHGDVVKTKVEQYFAHVQPGKNNKYDPVLDAQNNWKANVTFKDTDQAHMCVGVRGYRIDHPDRYVLDVLATILGGNMSSRLFHEVREKRGLAYSIGVGSEEYLDCGYLVAQGGFRIPSVDEALRVILDQFEILTKNYVSDEELRRAKDYWKGKMVLALEDSYRVASFYTGKEVLLNYTSTPEEVLQKVDKVTADDILRVAKDIFKNKNLNLSAIGPFKKTDCFDNSMDNGLK